MDWSCSMHLFKLFLVFCIVNGGEGASLARKMDDENIIIKEIDVDRTVKEVEDILKNDPSLPRLTKGEIMSLIDEIKHQDAKQRQRGSKSLMVVLPYSSNSSASLEELYTKAPVTELLHDASDTTTSSHVTVATTTRPTLIASATTTISTTTTVSTTTKRPKRRRKPTSKKPQRSTTTTPPGPVYQPTMEGTTSGETLNTGVEWVPFEPVKQRKPANDHQHPHLPPTMQDTLEEIDPAVEPILFVTPAKKTKIPTPTTKAPDVAEAAEGLSPDMKDLLTEFGLLKPKGGSKKPESTTGKPAGVPGVEISPTVDPTSYMRFKPLPDSGADMSEDMRSFLANFGLIPSKRRRNKALRPSTRPPKLIRLEEVPAIHEEIFTPEMKLVLENLGLMEADRRRRAKALKQQHVFNPATTAAATDAEKLTKINRLLVKIRKLAEDKRAHSLSQDEVKELLVSELGEEVAKGGILLGAAQPDPLSLDELAEMLESNKNEVKRQEPTTTTVSNTETSEDSTEDTTATDPSTEEAVAATTTITEAPATDRTPSFEDLNESFGGAVTTTVRPNGLYFLLDWNTFLNVGTEERKVELNFSPKVGNPALFLPVNVP